MGISFRRKNNRKSDRLERGAEYNSKEFKTKIAKVRIARVMKFVIPIAVILVVVLIGMNQWDTRVFTTYEVKKTKDLKWISGTNVIELDGNIITYSRDGMSCTNQAGKTVWNQTYEMQNPIVVMNGDKIAIGDYNGRTIYVCSSEKILGNISTNMPIRNLTVSGTGIVAAVLEDTDISWINVFTVDGRNPITIKTEMKNWGYPLGVAFSPNNDLLAISYLFVENQKPTTKVAFYNFSDVGQNYQDKLVSTYEYQNTIVPALYFSDDEHAIAIGDNRIMFYQGGQIPKSQLEELNNTDEVQQIITSNGYVGIVYLNESQDNRYRIKVYNGDGKCMEEVVYDFECNHMLVKNNWIILYNEENCKIVTFDGKVKLETVFDEPMHLILPTERTYKYSFLLGDQLELVELK